VARSIAQTTLEQAGIVDALEIAFVTLLVDDGNPLGIGEKDAEHRRAAFDVRAEVVEWVGMATLDHGVRFRGE
jgi:hypothetical protein